MKKRLWTESSPSTPQSGLTELFQQARRPLYILTILLIIGLPAALIGLHYTVAIIHDHEFTNTVEKTAASFSHQIHNSNISGAVQILGMNPVIIETAEGKRTVNNAPCLEILEQVKNIYQAAIVYVLDRRGNAVASTNYAGDQSLTGKNYSFRPYYIEAMQHSGKVVLYAAQGVTTGQPGLYYACSVSPSSTPEDAAGVVVIKMPIDRLKDIFKSIPYRVALVNPHGYVFITNYTDWADKKLIPDGIDENSLTPDVIRLQLAQCCIASRPVHLNDPDGPWEIVFADTQHELVNIYTQTTTLSIGLLGYVIAILVILGIYAQRRERMQKQQIQKEHEAFQTHLLEGNPTPTFVLDRDHRISFWNPACEELTGLSAEDMTGTQRQGFPFYMKERKTLADLVIDQASQEEMAKHYEHPPYPSTLIQDAWCLEGYFAHLPPSGRWLSCTAAPIYDLNGQIIGAIETLQDITPLKRIQHDLNETNRYIQSIMDTMPIGLVVYTMSTGAIQYVNQTFKDYFDFDIEQTPDMNRFNEMIIPQNLLRGHYLPMESENDSGIIEWENVPYHCEESEEDRFFAARHLPLSNQNARICAIWDMTERVRTEKALREARDQADNSIRQIERMNTDLQAAIQEAREMTVKAQAANHAKNIFLANMSHELRTPLNAVIGFSEILIQDLVDTEQLEFADMIHSAGQNLLGILNDILDYSKIETGKLSVQMTEFSPTSILDDIQQSFQSLAKKKGLALTLETAPDIPAYIISDPQRIRQCLANLVSNAIKFTERGHITLRTQTQLEQDQLMLQFEVEDTGIGIDKEKLQDIFEPFDQADLSYTRQYGGAGLGLTITHELIELLHGHLSVKSTPGQGSVFSISIPTQTPLFSASSLGMHI